MATPSKQNPPNDSNNTPDQPPPAYFVPVSIVPVMIDERDVAYTTAVNIPFGVGVPAAMVAIHPKVAPIRSNQVTPLTTNANTNPSATGDAKPEKPVKETWFRRYIYPIYGVLRTVIISLLELIDFILAITVYFEKFTGCSANYFSNSGLNITLFSALYLIPVCISVITFAFRIGYVVYLFRVKYRGNFRKALETYADMTSLTNEKMNVIIIVLIIRIVFECLLASYLLTYIAVYTIGALGTMPLARIVFSIISSTFIPAGTYHNMVVRPVFQYFSKQKFTFSGFSVFVTIISILILVAPIIWMSRYSGNVIYKGQRVKDAVSIYSGEYTITSVQCPNSTWVNVPSMANTKLIVPANLATVVGPLPIIIGSNLRSQPLPNFCQISQIASNNYFSCVINSLSIPMGTYSGTLSLSNVTLTTDTTTCHVISNNQPLMINSTQLMMSTKVNAVLNTKCIPNV